MRRRNILGAILGLVFSWQAMACPDFGIGIKGLPGKMQVRVTGEWIYVTTPSGKASYAFSFDSKSGKEGQWCYTRQGEKLTAAQQKEACGDYSLGKEIILIDGKAKVGVVRTYPLSDTRLSETKEKGAFLALLALGEDGRTAQPWLRFVSTYTTEPKGAGFSRLDKWEAALLKEGGDAKDYSVYALHHRMYVDLFSNPEAGITDQPTVLGSAVIRKTQQPFNHPKALVRPETSEADLNGKHWQTAKDSEGCESTVEEIK